MIVTGIKDIKLKDGTNKLQILLGEPTNVSGYEQVTYYTCDVDYFNDNYDDLDVGTNVDVEFGSYNGRLFIKSIKY